MEQMKKTPQLQASWLITCLCCLTILLLALDLRAATTEFESEVKQNTAISLWQLKHKEATIYLFGSIHMMPPEFYPLDEEIEAAFSSADHAVFEMDLAESRDTQKVSNLLREFALFNDGRSLNDVIDTKTRVALGKHLAENNGDIKNVQQMKPWFVGIQIAVQAFQKQGFLPQFGLDEHFNGQAIKQNKSIIGMETMRQQLSFLAEDSYEVQNLSLSTMLDDLDEMPKFASDMMAAWQTGDAEALFQLGQASADSHPALKSQMKKLIDVRNKRWIEHIKVWAETDEAYFVVVGALHMGGPNGLLQLLSHDYTITQIHHSDEWSM